MARAPKDHKTNALRELDAAGIPTRSCSSTPSPR